MSHQLHLGDCLEVMKTIPDGGVDMVLTDPPYGTTACKWDSVIPFEPMWEQLKRITKKNGAIVMTASQPFTTTLIASNMEMFKYCWVWEKSRATGFLDANRRPLNNIEDVVVFCDGNNAYYPQMKIGAKHKRGANKRAKGVAVYSNFVDSQTESGEYFPNRIVKIGSEPSRLHPTQKPVALMAYLIKTYTKVGETVLDFTMGSGTTGVAAMNLDRNFIGIELDPSYFKIAENRIKQAARKLL